jgi:hypothetical protein
MDWKFGGWKDSKDGSSMKVTDNNGVLKTERVSNTEKPHTHDIVKVDRVTGRVQEISRGENAPRGKK